jgi:hypothetical protein
VKPLGDIPRGIEVLVKKAAVDAAFRETFRTTVIVCAAAAMLAAVTAAIAKTDDIREPNINKYGWDDYGVVNGILSNDIFGEELSGVTVKLRGSNATCVTDVTGQFELKPILPGSYHIQFLRNNEVFFSFEYDSIDVEPGCTSTIEFKPRGSKPIADLIINPIENPTVFYGPDAMVTPTADYGKVRGVVTNTIGKPVADALVVVRGTSRYCTTAADGSFEITGIPKGIYEVKVSRVGHGEVTKKRVRVRDNSYTDLGFTLIEASCGGIRPGEIHNREQPSALNTLMNKIFGKDDE